jgi:ribosomal peptide maturation radical SAM protein 1
MGLEYLGRVDAVDIVVTGEGDRAFPQLLDALATGADPGVIPGVARRSPDGVTATPPAPPIGRLDDLPTPDYTEYFARAKSVGLLPDTDRAAVSIPFEAARGCWWGAKHHCVFCGLNGSTMAFRAKTAGRVLAELSEQARQCRSLRFAAVDNILDPAYLRDLLPRLVESGADYEMFFEVKANLTRAQVRLLAQAGVTRIQPGIESLSTAVLRVMRKGVRAIQNVNLLRWARYYGIHVDWNLIWGFPGDDPADYARQAGIVPDLVHLQPPSDANRLWMERFSPLFTQPETFPVKFRQPERSYRHVYPESVDLERVAYFFDYQFVDALPDSAYSPLRQAVGEWQRRWAQDRPPTLTFRSTAGLLQIVDGRHPHSAGTYTFEDPIAEIYVAASDRPITVAALHGRLRSSLPMTGLCEILDALHRRGLILRDDDLVLSLALPGTPGR